jgi:spore germination cell wall hydrolase CwlJ-like protein
MTEMLIWLTMTVWFESRGEPEHCQFLIAKTALNRMGPDGDIKKVILAPYQFSWVPEKMINGVLKPEFRPSIGSPGWVQAERAAKTAIYSSATFPATHFHATWIEKPKSWGNLKLVRTCGQHHFYS